MSPGAVRIKVNLPPDYSAVYFVAVFPDRPDCAAGFCSEECAWGFYIPPGPPFVVKRTRRLPAWIVTYCPGCGLPIGVTA